MSDYTKQYFIKLCCVALPAATDNNVDQNIISVKIRLDVTESHHTDDRTSM